MADKPDRTREIRPSGMKRGACGNVSHSCKRRISVPASPQNHRDDLLRRDPEEIPNHGRTVK